MKKNLTLISLVLGVMLLVSAMGVVSAIPFGPFNEDSTLNGVFFTNPLPWDYVSGDLEVEWTNYQTFEPLYLRYWDGSSWELLEGGIGAEQLTHDWDTTSVNDGSYWLRLASSDEYTYSGLFCVDNTAPDVTVCVDDGCCPESEGIESDKQTIETQTTIEITYGDTISDCNGECTLECTIDWGDETSDDCDDQEVCGWNDVKDVWECTHQYGDNDDYDIVVSVEDCAGNVGTAEDTATVENVLPVCEFDIFESDIVEGLPLTFVGSVEDVLADLEVMSWSWTFGNGDSDTSSTNLPISTTGNPTSFGESSITYTYDETGSYDVVLTVDDGTDSNTCTSTIDVADVIELENQETAGCEQFSYEFDTGISGVACSLLSENSLLDVYSDGTSCIVTGSYFDENDVGTHKVIVKADGSETEYYSFFLEVYDYAIHLEEGWNLISIPLVPENDDTSLDAVLGGIKENIATPSSGFSIFQYDGVAGEWIYTRPTASGWSGASGAELETMVPGYGYWIKMDTADILYLNGEKMYNADSNAYPPSVTLAMDSWNLIGVYGMKSCCFPYIRTSDALISLTDEEENAYYDIIYDEDGNNPFFGFLKSKEGYWLSVKKVFAGDETIEYKANYFSENHWFSQIPN